MIQRTVQERPRRSAPRPVVADVAEVLRPIETTRELDLPRAMPSPELAPSFTPNPRSERLERALNVTIAAVALVLVSPLMVFLALLVRFSSSGPIFYAQTRVGLDRRKTRLNAIYDRRMQDLGGRIFTIYKFRTMFVDAESATGAVWASKHDPRVTKIGRVMRALRLDELPQLWNVVKGDMNVVGPRPERPSIFARLRANIEEYPLRQLARPGITGWAQINHSYDTSLDDVRTKVRFDLEYLQRQGVGEDLKIMFKTFPVILFRRGGW